jgi:hypothetical protein
MNAFHYPYGILLIESSMPGHQSIDLKVSCQSLAFLCFRTGANDMQMDIELLRKPCHRTQSERQSLAADMKTAPYEPKRGARRPNACISPNV